MERAILFLPRAFRALPVRSALEGAGVRVFAAADLGKLHRLLESGASDLAILPGSIFSRIGTTPLLHLRRTGSTLTVISFRYSREGGMRTRVDRLAGATATDERIKAIRGILASVALPADAPLPTARDQAGVSDSDGAALLRELLPALHRKLGEALSAIVNAGDRGASILEISCRLWGEEPPRTADVQSYVCKLRRAMAESGPPGYAIRLRGDRYRLERERA